MGQAKKDRTLALHNQVKGYIVRSRISGWLEYREFCRLIGAGVIVPDMSVEKC